ncbi:Protein HPO-18, partial [Aphelenchoides avenae]
PQPLSAKMSFWRNAGITYLRYSQIAADVARKCIRDVPKAPTAPKEPLNIVFWENGKAKKAAE